MGTTKDVAETDDIYSQMTNYAHDVAEALNVKGDVEVVTSEGLTGKKKQAKGWYDPKTGKITIVADNHTNAADIEQTDASTAWDALMEQTEGDEAMAHEIADEMVKDKTADLAKVENEPIAKGKTPTEKLAARKAHKAKVEQAKQELEQWKAIANVDAERKAKAAVERQEAEKAKAEKTQAKDAPVTEPQPIGKGAFGNIYDQFKGKAKTAIDFLRKIKSGEAIGALHHKDIGDISLIWGNKKAGLEKILAKHPEVVDKLQTIIDEMDVVSESDNRIKLESPTHFAVVSKEYEGQPRDKWLLTAYEKKNSVSDNTMDTDETHSGERNDTATPQNTVSSSKVINNPSDLQGNGEKDSVQERNVETDAAIEEEISRKLEDDAELNALREKLGDVEDMWEKRIEDYLVEHYPNGFDGTRARTAEQQALHDAERKAAKEDAVLKKMREDAKAEFDAVDAELSAAYKRREEFYRKEADEGVLFRTSKELNKEYGNRWLTEQTNEDVADTDDIYSQMTNDAHDVADTKQSNRKNLVTSGSYFSGGGLLEEGLRGIINPQVAVEFNEKIAGVYADNHGNHIVTADVHNVDPSELVGHIDGEVQYFHASPVCKNFSTAKRNAEEIGIDVETAQSTADFIHKIRPKVVTIPLFGIRNSKNSEQKSWQSY